ncbi:ABC transporter permease [Catenovulum sp. SM1970]|uniref:ABC transporter permease n=1 Tax=Marinifaba aquimaris TaxID=2741323 RepID=UPI001573A5CF|nr:ABC transporter permease [Marinifaba aquimaris]NTS77813.1 ABC transporter permease [Marinifaba aquimaris]
MFAFLLRRFNLMLSTLFIISLIGFSLGHLFPGDPVENYSGIKEFTYSEYIALTEAYKVDENLVVQYWAYIQRTFSGDLGLSLNSQTPVLDEIKQVLPATVELSVYALLIAIFIGIPLGILAGIKHKKPTDNVLYSFSIVANSIPIFWLGLLFILFLSLNFKLLPMSGRHHLLYEIPNITGFVLLDTLLLQADYKWLALKDAMSHLILPTLTLAMVPITLFLTITRSSVIQVMQTSYVKAAKTKGLSNWKLIRKHILRNALLPVLPQIALTLNTLMTSAMITEVIFSWPGIGNWLIEAIYQRDYPAIQAGLIVVATFVMFMHIIVDVLHTVLNPLIRK